MRHNFYPYFVGPFAALVGRDLNLVPRHPFNIHVALDAAQLHRLPRRQSSFPMEGIRSTRSRRLRRRRKTRQNQCCRYYHNCSLPSPHDAPLGH